MIGLFRNFLTDESKYAKTNHFRIAIDGISRALMDSMGRMS